MVDNVSPSKILDCFILEKEQPSIIVSFLQQHDGDFMTIIKNSLYSSQIFEIDFFMRCSLNDMEYIVSKLDNSDIFISTMLCWQILMFKTHKIPYHIVNKVRRIYKTCMSNPNIPHPYSDKATVAVVKKFDKLLFNHINNKLSDEYLFDDILINEFAEDELLNACNERLLLTNSLFRNRLMQLDVATKLSPKVLFVYLNNMYKYCNLITYTHVKDFTIQILECDEIQTKIKYFCYKKYKTTIFIHEANAFGSLLVINTSARDAIKIIDESVSFSEFMLKTTVENINLKPSDIFYLALCKMSWLKEWIKYDKDELNSYINISDFVESFK